MVSEVPGYSLNIYDNYTTFLGEDLNGPCTDRYGNDWLLKTLSMTNIINNQITQGDLCAGEDGRFSAVSATSSFNSQGSEVGIKTC